MYVIRLPNISQISICSKCILRMAWAWIKMTICRYSQHVILENARQNPAYTTENYAKFTWCGFKALRSIVPSTFTHLFATSNIIFTYFLIKNLKNCVSFRGISRERDMYLNAGTHVLPANFYNFYNNSCSFFIFCNFDFFLFVWPIFGKIIYASLLC